LSVKNKTALPSNDLWLAFLQCCQIHLIKSEEFPEIIFAIHITKLKLPLLARVFSSEKKGRALLESAKTNYSQAKQIADENPGGIDSYDDAKLYLDSFYNAYFKNSYGIDIVLPRNRISESAVYKVAWWIPNYINHLGSKLLSHQFLWGKIGTDAKDLINLVQNGVDSMEVVNEFVLICEEINDDIQQLGEDESFPVDYTLALVYQDSSMLWERWGIHGVDNINLNIACPAELRVYDSNSNVTGILTGGIRMEIPNSFYYNNTVTIFLPNDTYIIEVMGTGTDEGFYSLMVSNTTEGEISTFKATDIPTSSNVIHQYTINWNDLSQGEDGINIQIDADGDGTFEQTITADNELTHDEFMLQTETIIDINPDTLNLNSSGNWITCYIELPDNYGVADIDTSTVLLNDVVPAEDHPTDIGDYDNDGIPDLMVKFDRQVVQGILEPGENVAITVTGKLFAGTQFEGTDYIRVI